MTLPNWGVRVLGHADEVVEALAHLAGAVGADQDRHRQRYLGGMPLLLLQVAAEQEVEELLGAAQFDIGPDLDGVLALHQGVEVFVERNRLAALEAIGEVLAGRELGDRDLAHQVEDVQERPFAEPVAIVVDLGPLQVDDPTDLGEVVLGVGRNLIFGQDFRTSLVAARGVADQGGVVADDDDGGVPEVLELAELAQGDGVAEVDADGGWVDAVLDPKGLALADRAFQLAGELVAGDDRVGPPAEDIQLLGGAQHRAIGLPRTAPAATAAGPGRF